ncbi:putative reverse transcriptase domain-containing protein [Tanacetum coccineum]
MPCSCDRRGMWDRRVSIGQTSNANLGTSKRWLGRTSSDLLKTWDELKRVFIRRFCPPSVTFRQIGEIHNFWQEEGETLYQTWERFNDLLFKCPFNDINDYHKELVSNKIQIEELSMVKLNARCSAISMQSPKGIVENVLVKIYKFIFPVDLIILDIIEDNKVPIILGRPMLATAHARIDVFRGKISLEVGKEQVIFNANEGATPETISPVCAIKDFDVIDNIEGGNRMIFDDFLKDKPKPWEPSFNDDKTPRDQESTSQNKFCQEDPISNIKTYFLDFSRPQPIKPRPRDYSYEEWLKLKLGNTNGFEEEERWESGIEKTDYEPPFVEIETFEIKRYFFKGGRSFVCITKPLDDALPLGRVNGSRFMEMIRKEMDEDEKERRKM